MSLWSYVNVAGFSRRKRIHFIVNIIVGIAIAAFFHVLERTDWGEDLTNKAFDFVVAKEAEKASQSAESLRADKHDGISDEIVFVEIDHETYKKWGRPVITPREELARLIAAAYKGGARVIVLDMLLEDKDCCHPESDMALQRVLEDMGDQEAAPKVIFPVRLGRDGDIRGHRFSELIKRNPNFHYATANISASATDRVVRYWVPYEISAGSGHDALLWNVSFLAAVLANGKARELKEVEGKVTSGQFREAYFLKLGNMRKIVLSPARDDIYRNRIRFFLIPRDTLPGHWGGNLFTGVYGVDEVHQGHFKDKIVIIGNSSPDAGDLHPTPVGNMAGMYIIGNAINTILLGIQPSRPPAGVNILIEAVVILMAAYLFLYFRSFVAHVLGSTILVATLGVASYYYFLKTGVFLNVVFAVAGMGFHKIASNIEEIIEKRGQEHREH